MVNVLIKCYSVNPQEQVSFQTALNHKWTPNTSIKKRKYEDPSYLIFKSNITYFLNMFYTFKISLFLN